MELWQACVDGNIEEVRKLLQNTSININWQDLEYSRTPFLRACYFGHIEVVKLLLNDERVDINKPQSQRASPFYIACQGGHTDIVRLLLDDGRADINQAEMNGRTPIYTACFNGHIEVVKLLLNDQRVDVNKANIDNWTPFHSACGRGHPEIVKLLLSDQRVDINKSDGDLRTPFHMACEKGCVEVVKLLLVDKRIDTNQANSRCTTPFNVACKQGRTEIVNLLRNESNPLFNFILSFFPSSSFLFFLLIIHLFSSLIVENKLNLKEEVERYNQNLQQNKDIINSIQNLRDLLLYFPESITLEIKRESIQNFVQAFKSCQEDQRSAFFWIIESVSLNDEIVRIFREVGGIDVVANSFIDSAQKIQESLLIQITIMVSNYMFRDNFGKNQEFLDSLIILFSETKGTRLAVAGILLNLAGYISNKEIVKMLLEKMFFSIIRNNLSSKESMDKTLDCLMDASAIDTSKSILLELGTKEIIQPFVEDQDSSYHFVCCIIQAFLSSNDVNQNNEFGSNPTSPKVISKILDAFQIFINTEAQDYHHTNGYFLNCYHVLIALGSLARNEANMKELKNNGIAKKIIEFTQNRKDNLLKTNERTIEELSTVIWVLSFDQDCKDEFLKNGLVEILKGFNIEDNESVKRAVDGALFTLIGNQNQNQNRNEIKGQVMISYCWEEKEKARGIANYLKSKNIPVWIDIEQMEGSVLEAMAEAVEESSIILVFLSSKYKESQACRTEAEYAYKLKKEVICIMAEDNYQPRGWLGALLGNKLWYNPWKNMIFDEESFSPILSQLSKLFDQPKIVAQVQEKKQDQKPKPIQTPQQSTNNDQQQQQILNLLEKICNKMDEFENRLQKVESQNKENFEKLEIQNKENLRTIEQRFEKVEKMLEKRKNLFGK